MNTRAPVAHGDFSAIISRSVLDQDYQIKSPENPKMTGAYLAPIHTPTTSITLAWEKDEVLGILLLLGGIAALAYGGFSYTTHKKAIDMGPVQIDRTRQHNVPLPPILGIGGILVGGVLLFAGSRTGR